MISTRSVHQLAACPEAPDAVPPRAGVGLKAAHYRAILETRPPLGFFEVHAENYMGAGGPPHRYLTAIRAEYPLSLHGVGLSIGADGPLDQSHLRRVAHLVRRYQPGLFSEHLAWSSHGGVFFNDLLPVPYTTHTLQRVCEHVHQVQEHLKRPILLENPSTYLTFEQSRYAEVDFLAETVRRTGCALLLDLNNVYVSCTNQHSDPVRYLERFPLAQVREVHLAGFAPDLDEHAQPLLIDAHDRPVEPCVWHLYARTLAALGPVPTLIEWDQHLPPWDVLHSQARHAQGLLDQCRGEQEPIHAAVG